MVTVSIGGGEDMALMINLVEIVIMEHGKQSDIPRYQTPSAAGFDLRAAIPCPYRRAPGKRYLCPTGLRMKIPEGYDGQVRPRSGLALKHGVTVLNSPGTVDSDYRGEVKVILINHGEEYFTIEPGMRIAQMVFAPCEQMDLFMVMELSDENTKRGHGGFGSTGVL